MNVAGTLSLNGVWSSHLIGLEAEIGSHRRSITEKEPGRLHQDFHGLQPFSYKTERTNTDVFARRRITCYASQLPISSKCAEVGRLTVARPLA
jgi:hypothetical protein